MQLPAVACPRRAVWKASASGSYFVALGVDGGAPLVLSQGLHLFREMLLVGDIIITELTLNSTKQFPRRIHLDLSEPIVEIRRALKQRCLDPLPFT